MARSSASSRRSPRTTKPTAPVSRPEKSTADPKILRLESQLSRKLVGRILALNPEKAAHFSTFGFYVTTRVQNGLVPVHADFYGIQRAIDNGVLIDITDQKKGIHQDNFEILPVEEDQENNPVKTVYRLTRCIGGSMLTVFAAPKDEAQARAWAFRVANTGRLELSDEELDTLQVTAAGSPAGTEAKPA